MPYIVGTGVACPLYKFQQKDIKPFVKSMFAEVFQDIDRLLGVFENSHIDTRYFCVPMDWFHQPVTYEEKNSLYIRYAIELGMQALKNCLTDAKVDLKDVKHLFLISSTGIATPSIDAHILGRMGADPKTKRTPIWGLGCAGGVAGISRAYEYVKAFPRELAAVIAIELCGLTFQRNDLSKSNLVATSLFADGAAAVVLSGDDSTHKGKLRIKGTMSTLWKDTLEVMGWDLSSSGFHVVFSRDIPTIVKTIVAENTRGFLQSFGHLEVDHFILHPGGKKVLDAYEQSLSIPAEKLNIPRQILREYGNMSSCTVLYVLNEYLKKGRIGEGDIGLISALGPGFSSELVMVEGTPW